MGPVRYQLLQTKATVILRIRSIVREIKAYQIDTVLNASLFHIKAIFNHVKLLHNRIRFCDGLQ